MFEIIGERINTSRKAVREAVENRDEAYIINDVKKQAEAGAAYIDINAATAAGQELDNIKWLIHIIQETVALPLCIDSPDPEILKAVYNQIKQPPLINSISLEKNRFEPMLSFLQDKECRIIGLCMSDEGMPKNAEDVIERADKIISGLEKTGMKHEHIYIDPIVQPISTDSTRGTMAMDSVIGIKKAYPEVKIICGLSNISFGLPQRKTVNRTFLTLMLSAGIDSAILDPLNEKIISELKTALMLLGRDAYCMEYTKAAMSGKISP